MAVPAKRTTYTVAQPDGSTLTVMLVGDEHGHMLVSADDRQPVVKVGDTYYFACVGLDGSIEASTVKAADEQLRNVSQRAFVAENPREAMFSALDSRRTERMSARRSPLRTANEGGINTTDGNVSAGYGLDNAQFPATGQHRALVVLVNYTDIQFKVENPNDYFTRMFNEQGFSEDGGTGSASEYYYHSSNGKLDITFDVYGPVDLPNNRKYYGANNSSGDDKKADDMVRHAVAVLDLEGVDFSPYDTDGDGTVDNICIVYAGVGESSSNISDAVWPHSYDLRYAGGVYTSAGGQKFDHYICLNELEKSTATSFKPDGIGTFVHEFGHALGLPDLYCTSNSSSTGKKTPGDWDVMDYGCYLNDSRTPPTMSSFSRNALGWNDAVVLKSTEDITIRPLESTNDSYIILTDSPLEFFLLENRQQEGWDAYLPGHGMLVWHIDYNSIKWQQNAVNNNGSHQYIDIIEACNSANNLSTATMAGYPFPGTKNVTTLSAETIPALSVWSGTPCPIALNDIAETADGNITVSAVNTDDPSGIADILADAAITVDGRTIRADKPVTVVDLLGRNVAADATVATVPCAGTYLVAAEGKVAKISVK